MIIIYNIFQVPVNWFKRLNLYLLYIYINLLLQKYINNITGLQLFQLLRFGTMLLISIVFAKSSLPTEAIGNYELFIFISMLVSSFWLNSLIQSLLPLYKNPDQPNTKNNKSPEIFNAYIIISLLSILTILLLIIFQNPLSKVISHSGSIPYFNLILIYTFFSNPSFLIEYIYLLKNKPGSIIRYGVVSFSVHLVFVSLPVILGMGLQTALLGLLAVTFARYCWLLFLLSKHAQLSISTGFIKKHLHYAWPLMISSLVGGSAIYVDGFLVVNKFDSATFAIFRYGAREFPLVMLMANALSTAMIKDFSLKENLQTSLHQLRKKSENLMHLLFPVTIVFLLSSQWLYPVIFNSNFRESADIFNIYLLLITTRLLFPHTILIGSKKMNIIMYASFAELLTNVILSIIFINIWGIEGIAFATVIAYTLQKVIWIVYNKKVLNISPRKYIPLRTFAFYCFMTILIFTFML